jgi:hypothetical protein
MLPLSLEMGILPTIGAFLVVAAAGKSLRVAAIVNSAVMTLLAAAANRPFADGFHQPHRFPHGLEHPVARLAQRMGPLAHVSASASPDSAA